MEYKQAIILGAAPLKDEAARLLAILKWAGFMLQPDIDEKNVGCGGSCKGCTSHCPEKEIKKDVFLAAADGGILFLQEHNIKPDYFVGDMDSVDLSSVDSAYLDTFEWEQVPVEKDDTDTALAVKKAYEKGYREMMLYGCGGGERISHTIANLQLMCRYERKGCHIKLMGANYQMELLENGKQTFPKALRGSVSVFSLSDCSKNVVISGLKYEYAGDLNNRMPLGVSNSFIGRDAMISVEEGILLLIYEKA